MLEEGGYFAIQGFSYQYIVSLIEIFKSSEKNKQFNFEYIQDFNDNEVIYQMKYKATQHFTNSQIKEAVIKIFEQFNIIQKEYVLYTCFKDKTDEILTFSSVEELDKVLLNCKIDKKVYTFTYEQKEQFIKHFKVIFSHNYVEKVNELIEIIQEEFQVSKDIAEIYFYSLESYIINIIVNNLPQNRKCTKYELIRYLKNTSTLIFMDFFSKNMEYNKYLKFVRKEYFFEKNINDHNRIFIINCENSDINDLYDCVHKIIKKFYVVNKRNNMIKSHAPYIYFSNLSSEGLIKLKEKIFENYVFTDGCPYNGCKFKVEFITKKFLVKDNISCKIINTRDNLDQVIEYLNDELLKIYEFYINEHVKLELQNSYIIKISKMSDIIKILN